MQLLSNQTIINVSRNLQCFGFGVAILASTLAGQAEAQVNFSLTDVTPQAISTSVISPLKPIAIEKIHRYSLDEAGTLNGHITVTGDKPSGLSVYAMQGRQIVHQSTTNAAGDFAIAQITPGQYSIVIAGRNQLAAQGIMIDRDHSQNTSDFFELSTIQTSYQGVQDLVTTALPKQITTNLGGADSKFQQVSATLSDTPIAKRVQIINGNIRGQVVSLINQDNITGTTIHLLQKSKPVAQVEVDGEGYFTIPDAEAGIYDLVATADSGFAAMRVEAIANKTPMKMVSYSQQVPTELSVPLAEDCPCNQTQVAQPVQQIAMDACSQSPIQYASESIGCGGCCGGAGGAAGNFSGVSGRVLGVRGGANGAGGGFLGGGGVGGGGGFLGGGGAAAGAGSLTRLLTLASLAGAITAIADDDAQVASPSNN